MKKYMIQSWNPIPARSINMIENKLNKIGAIEEKHILGDYGCCFILTTDNSQGINAKTIKDCILNHVVDIYHSKIMIAKLDESEYEETESISESTMPYYYCFSHFNSYQEAIRFFGDLNPVLIMPDGTTRSLTFLEWIWIPYDQYKSKVIRYEDVVSRVLNIEADLCETEELKEGDKFFVRWDDGKVTEEQYKNGGMWIQITENRGVGTALLANHSLGFLVYNRISTKGARWFLTKEEAEKNEVNND